MKQLCKHFALLTTLSLLSVTLTGCGFHFRTKRDTPAIYKTLALQAPATHLAFTTSLKRTLTALGVHLSPKANIQLHIKQIKFSHDIPNVLNQNQPVTITYTYSLAYQLTQSHKKQQLPLQNIETSAQAIINGSDLLTSRPSAMTKSNLRRALINLLLIKLFSHNTRTALMHHEN